MAELIPLALGSALYPTLLAAVVLILAQDDPRRLLFAYVGGAMMISLLAGFVIVGALEGSDVVSSSTSSGRRVGPGVDIVIGLFALALFWGMLTNRLGRFAEPIQRRRAARKAAKESAEAAGDKRDPWSKRVLTSGSVKLAFLLGVALNLPGALYLIALKDIAAADYSAAESALLIVAYNLIMFALAEVPLVGYLVAPDATRDRVNRFNAWLGANGRTVAAALCGIAGTLLVLRGVVDLV